MKKLTKNQKTIMGVGAAALAVFALSGFGKSKTPTFKLVGIDPEKNQVYYEINGKELRAPIHAGTAQYIYGNGYNVYATPPVNGVKQFVWRLRDQPIAELGRLDVSAYPRHSNAGNPGAAKRG